MRSRSLLAAASGLLFACSFDLQIPEGAQLRCVHDNECPEGLICPQELPLAQRICVPAGGVRPVVDSIFVHDAQGVERLRFAPEQVVLIEIQTSQPLSGSPEMVLRFAGEDRPVPLKATLSSSHFIFEFKVAAGDPEGLVGAAVALISVANVPGSSSWSSLFTIDKTPPVVESVEVTLVPAAGAGGIVGTLPRVTRAKIGTQVEVRITFDEEIRGEEGGVRPVTVKATSAGVELPFDVSGANRTYLAQHIVGFGGVSQAALVALGPRAPFLLHVTALDTAGNLVSVADAETFEVDVNPPVVDPAAVLQLRRPWSSQAWGDGPPHELRGTAVANEVSETDAASTLVHQVHLYAFSGVSGPQNYLGNTTLDENGTIGPGNRNPVNPPNFSLLADAPRVFLVAVDAAGNPSQPALVTRGEWIGAFERESSTVLAPNPHRVYRVARSTDEPVAPLASPASPEQVGAVTSDQDFNVPWAKLTIAGARQWRPHRRFALPHQGAGMVWRVATGELVVYGGVGPEGPSDALFTALFGEWREVVAVGLTPGPRVGAAMVYDAARDRVVLFGGTPGDRFEARNDIWEWDGVDWFDLTPPGADRGQSVYPIPRFAAAAAYDPLRGRMVIFGGSPGGNLPGSAGDVWAWDGTGWTLLSQTGSGPEPRQAAALVYDAASDALILFGGFRDAVVPSCPAGAIFWPVSGTTSVACAFNDTWRFDLAGNTWSQVTTATRPPHRFDAVMVATAGGARLFGGCAKGRPTTLCEQPRGDLWRFTGDAWTEEAVAAGPAPSASAAAAYSDTGELWLLGGSGVLESGRVLACTDPGDPFFCPPGSLLTQRQQASLWSCECSSTRLWRHQAGSWTGGGGATPSPPAIEQAAVAYHQQRGMAVLFGGRSAGARCGAAAGPVCGATWIYDGSLWSQPSELPEPADCADPAPQAPCPRVGAGLAYRQPASGPAQLVLFGGEGAGGMCDGVSERCGRTWALSWDAETGWRWSDACPGCEDSGTDAPPPRSFAALSSAGDTVYLFGGIGDKPCLSPDGEPFLGAPGGSALDACRMGDLWSFDDGGWTKRGPFPSSPPPWTAGRWNFQMAADPLRGKLVMFSGCYEADDSGACPPGDYSSTLLTDSIYALAGGTWSGAQPLGLAPRFGMSLVRDAVRGRAVMFGGENQNGARFGDVWDWGGSGWSQVRVEGPVPGPRSGHGAVHDPAGRRMLLVGGEPEWEVWELDFDPDSTPSAVLAFGFGAADVADAVVDRITLAVTATGTGFTNNPGADAASVDGYRVEGWSTTAGAWLAWTCAPAAGAPNPERRHCTPPSPSDYLLGPGATIYVRVRPQGGAGSGDAQAGLELDLGELRVEYSR